MKELLLQILSSVDTLNEIIKLFQDHLSLEFLSITGVTEIDDSELSCIPIDIGINSKMYEVQGDELYLPDGDESPHSDKLKSKVLDLSHNLISILADGEERDDISIEINRKDLSTYEPILTSLNHMKGLLK